MRSRMVGALMMTGILVGVSACADNDRDGRADASICSPFTTTAVVAPADPTAVAPVGAAPVAGEAAAFDDCLHRWAYRLARADDDSADVVGQAVVAACAPVLASWNQATLTQAPAGTDTSAVSLVTGDTATTVADRYDMAQSKAVFYVVQARAGHCAPPPKTATAAK